MKINFTTKEWFYIYTRVKDIEDSKKWKLFIGKTIDFKVIIKNALTAELNHDGFDKLVSEYRKIKEEINNSIDLNKKNAAILKRHIGKFKD